MDNDRRNDSDKSMAATAAVRPAAQDMDRRQTNVTSPDPVESDDPFATDMTDVANENVLDGNAQVNSPQAIQDDEGSPGNSR